MDELAASMASAAQVTASGGASTAAPHPHYSDLYKHRATTLIHQQRRRDHLLQSQKQWVAQLHLACRSIAKFGCRTEYYSDTF